MTSYILIGAVLVLASFIMVVYNCLVQLNNKVNEAYSTMDVYLKQRFDLIPNLVDIVKGYARHESETLEKLTRHRASVGKVDLNGKIDGEVRIGQAICSVLAVVEKYPDLKANRNFLDLQNRMTKIEESIAFARRYFNGSVREYNDKCQMFPFNLVAGIFGFKARKMYEIEREEERDVPVMD